MISDNEQTARVTEPAAVILALQRATHATLRVLVARLADLDLPGSEINALAILADGRVRSVGELAASAGTRPTTLTSVLDRLAGRGYLTRDTDPADRRSFLLHLTETGHRAAARARSAMAAVEQQALAALSPADLAGFAAVVNALAEVQP